MDIENRLSIAIIDEYHEYIECADNVGDGYEVPVCEALIAARGTREQSTQFKKKAE